MNRITMLMLATVVVMASCGGGGSGPTPTPTSDATKAASTGVLDEAMSAAGEGANNGLSHLAPAAMVIEKDVVKAPYTGTIDMVRNCAESGTVTITGSMTAQCTEDGTNWSCTSMSAPMTLVFNACTRLETVGSTTYSIVIDGASSATLTGSASGTMAAGPQTGNFTGTFVGTPSVSGDVAGTVCISSLEFTGTVSSGAEPTVTCTGTTDVTIGTTEQVCGVATDCSTCTE
jgi:hypothetical protein